MDTFDVRTPKNAEIRIVLEVWEAGVRKMLIIVSMIIAIAGRAGPVVYSLIVMAANRLDLPPRHSARKNRIVE